MKKQVRMAASVFAIAAMTTVAQAADFDPINTYDWTGFYAGLHLGVAGLDTNDRTGFVQPNSTGIAGGGHAGYNFQIDNLVLGVEGDFSGLSNSKTKNCVNPAFSCNASADWTGSIRARAGWAADRFLIFGTGGVAFLGYDGFTRLDATGVKFSDSKTFTGWTIGGGAEYAWTDQIIFGAEASYSQFGRKTLNYDTPYSAKPDLFVARVRASFKF